MCQMAMLHRSGNMVIRQRRSNVNSRSLVYIYCWHEVTFTNSGGNLHFTTQSRRKFQAYSLPIFFGKGKIRSSVLISAAKGVTAAAAAALAAEVVTVLAEALGL